MKQDKPNIFNYKDYRKFLKDFYNWEKGHFPGFSLTIWAKRLGIKNKSSLSLIIGGRRDPSKVMLNKFVTSLQFDEQEKNYFLDLVQLQKFYHKEGVSGAVKKILKLNGRPVPKTLLDNKIFKLISPWYHFAIKEMVNLNDFQESVSWIRNKLNVSVESDKIQNALSNLILLGILRRDESGRLVQGNQQVFVEDGNDNPLIQDAHMERIELSSQLIKKTSAKDRYVTSLIFTMKRKKLEEASKMINDFEDNMLRLFEEGEAGEGDVTVCLNTYLFPLTK